MSLKLTKNLYLHEYIPQSILKKYGNKAIRLIDARVVNIDQKLRDRYGPIHVNMEGLQYRGYRPISYYIKKGRINSHSQHKFGRASDKHFKNVSVDEVYYDILKNQEYWLGLGLTTMENISFTHPNRSTSGWLHTDCRNPEPRYINEIRIVNP